MACGKDAANATFQLTASVKFIPPPRETLDSRPTGPRGIRVTESVLRDEAIAVFAAYGASNSVVYNARGTGSLRD